MRNIVNILFCLFLSYNVGNAQSIKRSVISSYGSSSSSTNINLGSTLGQPSNIGTISDGSNYIRQGFQQPKSFSSITINGCLDPLANNYNPFATIDDSTCLYSSFVFGCTDTSAINYNLLATVDDSSCCYNTGQLWSQISQDIDGEAAGDESGWSVSLSSDGTTVAIGAHKNDGNGSDAGHVRIYENTGGFWSQIGQDIDGVFPGVLCGHSVSLSSDGNTVAIGSSNSANGGLVQIYENISGSWSQIGQYIFGETGGDQSGFSVSLSSDGNTVAIGAINNDGNGLRAGHVRIYENISGIWTQIGQDIDGEAWDDQSGFSVSLSLDGNTVAIGARYNDENGTSAGHVRIYENTGGSWSQIGQDIDGGTADDHSGHSVSLSSDGNTVAIGSVYSNGNGNDAGHVRIYENISGSWSQIGQDIDGEAADDYSGWSVSLSSDGNTVAIGAMANDVGQNGFNGFISNSGHVRIYKNISAIWTQIGQDINGEAWDDQSGWSVSLSSDGNTVSIGARYNDGNGSNSGHVRVYNLDSTNISSCADLGCLDPLALNFDAYAIISDSTCIYPSYGCIDPLALNYNSLSNIDDGSCIYCNINIVQNDTLICEGESITLEFDQSSIFNSFTSQIINSTLNNGLVAAYPFNGSVIDESGNGHNGLGNNISLSSDRAGNTNSAYSFNGTSSEIIISDTLLALASDFTISCWMKSTDINKSRQCLFNSIPHTGFAVEYNHSYFPTKLLNGIGPAIGYWDLLDGGSNDSFQQDTWYHVVLKKEGVVYKTYIDTTLDWQQVVNQSLNYTESVGLIIGGISVYGNEFFNGSLDDIYIWNRALSISEIQELYSMSPSGNNILWSTGDTTNSIVVTPNQTTTYYLSQTINGITCYDSVVITINSDTSFTNITSCDSVVWNGINYTSSGTYSFSDSLNNNYSMNFDGVDDYVTLNQTPTYAPTTSTDFTISIWVNPNTLHEGTIASQYENVIPSNCNFILGLMMNNTFRVSGNGYGYYEFGTPNIGIWQYVSLVFHSSGSVDTYVDGVFTGSSVLNLSSTVGTMPLEIGDLFTGGCSGCIGPFDGLLDNVDIWNTALTQQDIQDNMLCSPIGSESGLIGLWNFEEGSGTTAYDQTPNGNDGIINGAIYNSSVPLQSCNLTNINGCDSVAVLNLTITTCLDGCTDSLANNYNPFATINDSTCLYSPFIFGCTDSTALNYNPLATVDDSSCCYNSWNIIGSFYTPHVNYGSTVDLDSSGNIVVLGAPGHNNSTGFASVYDNSSGSWIQIGQNINGESTDDRFGTWVSISSNGNIIAIGAPYNDGNGSDAGHVRVFELISGSWTQIGQDIDGEATGDISGRAISLNNNGNILAIGARNNDGNGSNTYDSFGHVRVYQRFGNSWSQIGQDIDGSNAYDTFGHSVSLNSSGNIVAIGGDNNSNNGPLSGHVRVFEYIGGTWLQIGQSLNGEGDYDRSGCSVSINGLGNIVAIGADNNDDNGGNSGHVRVYENISGTWVQLGIDINGEAGDDHFGSSVSINSSGNIFASGAFKNDGGGNDAGHVRVFENISGSWTQIGQDIDGSGGGAYTGKPCSINDNGNIVASGSSHGSLAIYDLVFSCIDLGCLDPLALNFDAYANISDSTCIYPSYGCIDPLALNYNSLSNIDDGSCNYCTNDTSYTNITACDSVEWNGEWYDSSGTYYSNTGSNNNYSMSFDGIYDYCEIQHDSIFNYTSTGFTLQFNLKPYHYNDPNSPTFDYLLWKIDETNGQGLNGKGFDIGFNNSGIYFRYHPSGNIGISSITVTIDSSYLSLNNFQFITFSTDTNFLSAYVNGVLVGQTSIPSNFDSFDFGYSNIFIGCPQLPSSGYNAPSQAEIDNLQIWNRNITQNEIQQYMYCPPLGNETNLVGYWNFEEGSGNTAYDQTLNGNDGTINGATYDTNVPAQSCQLINSNGCDSVAVLNLTINQVDTSYTNITVCDSVEWNNEWYDSSGTYFHTINPPTFNNNSTALNFSNTSSTNVSMGNIALGLERSVSFWAKLDQGSMVTNPSSSVLKLANDFIVTFGDWGGDGIPKISVHKPSNSWVSAPVIDDGLWHQYTITATNGDSICFFQDGIFTAYTVNNGLGGINAYNYSYSNDPFEIATGLDGSLYNLGNIDDVHVWDKVLNQIEIDQFLLCPPNGLESNLIGYWNFEEGSGNIAYDQSISLNHGIINGPIYTSSAPIVACPLPNSNNCDSVAVLNLTINNSSTNTVTETACDSYTWDGVIYTSTALYTNFYTDQNGCDSTVRLDLTITTCPGCTDPNANNYNPYATLEDSTCLYSPFVFGCTDSTALNYDPLATVDDSSCCYTSGQLWSQIGQDIDGEAISNFSGKSISISGNGSIIAIGADHNNNSNGVQSGHVRVYENLFGNWSQIGQDIDGENPFDYSGNQISLNNNGNILAIGASYNNQNGLNSGHVRVYEYTSGNWNQIGQDIDGETGGNYSGHSVSLSSDGSTVAIGAPYNSGNGNFSGHVRIYENIGGSWSQIGQDIDGESADDNSGYSVSLSNGGNIVAIGASVNDGNGSNSGHVRIYENIVGSWSQIGQDIDGEASGDISGHSVSLSSDGSIVAIGATNNDDNGLNSGHVRIYENTSGYWSQIGQDIDGEASEDESGHSVSLSSDGNTVVIGAKYNDGNGFGSGHVRIYQNIGGFWSQIGQDIDGEAIEDQSGYSVSLSNDGSTVSIGALYNDGNGTNSGHVRVYSLSNPCADLGCLDPLALNFDPNATVSDSTCIYPNYGCTDLLANNYDPLSNIDDGSCNYCTNDTSYTNITACDSYTWNGITYDSSGTYTYLYNSNNYSINLDGTDDHALVADDSIYDFSNTFTIQARINADSWIGSHGGHAAIVSKMYHHLHPSFPAADGYELGIHNNSGSYRFQMGLMMSSGNHYLYYQDPLNSYTTGQWYNIVATFDNGLAKLYIDGEFKSSATFSGTIDLSPTDLIFGGRADLVGAGQYSSYGAAIFDGKIDEISMWNRALDSTEIANYHLCSPQGAENGLIGLWKFEEGTGNISGDLSYYDNNSLLVGGSYFNDASTQLCSYSNINGCDSIAILNLTINSCPGCTDSSANNYNPFATIDDSTCLYSPFVFGCTDSTALNYNPLATIDDSSCCYNSGQLWSQIGQDIDGEAAYDESGFSVSLSSDGNTVAIGARFNDENGIRSGHVRIYEKIGGQWSQIGQDIDGEAAEDYSGFSVSLSSDGTIVAIGAPFNGLDAGHVRIYENIGGSWSQIGQDIDGETAGTSSGISVSLSSDGGIVAIGAYGNDGINGNNSGHVRIYENISGSWVQTGQDIDGEAAGDISGWSVSLSSDGNTVAIGARGNDGNGSDAGHVRIYENIGGSWSQIGQDLDGETAGDENGWSVSLSNYGSTVAIGSPYNDVHGYRSGHVRIYENIGGSWSQIGQNIDGEAYMDQSGKSVSLSSDGSIIAIGAYGNDGNGVSAGHVRIYENIGGSWSQIGQDIDGEANNNLSGYSVSISSDGNTVAIGAYENNGNGYRSGHVRVYSLSTPCSDLGCLDPLALNFDPNATVSDSTCIYPNYGCIDPLALNYNYFANIDDGTCTYCVNDTSYTNITSCDSILWNGINYYSSGTYSYLDTTSLGCDSITYLNLIINSSSNSFDTVVAYNNYTWNNVVFTSSVFYSIILTNSVGCDSIAYLDLTILLNYGCTDPNAINYDPSALFDDGSCCIVSYQQIGQDIDGQNNYDFSGQSVAISDDGSIIAVGAHHYNNNGNNNSGNVRVFENIGGVWSQKGLDINGVNSYDYFGEAISISSDGSIIAIGAWGSNDNGPNSGHVRIFEFISGFWMQIGSNIIGESSFDQSGSSVSLNSLGNRVAIGSMTNNGNGSYSGHVRVYENMSGGWVQIGLDIDGESSGDQSGSSIALNSFGNIVAVGAKQNDGSANSAGHVRVFEFINGIWTQVGQDIDGASYMDRSGNSVSINNDGSIVAVGASLNDDNGINSGHVRIFKNINNSWQQIGQDIDGEYAYDQSGWSIDLNNFGNTIAIGSPYNDNNGPESGQVRIYNYIDSNWTRMNSGIEGEAISDLSGWSVRLSEDGYNVVIGAKENDDNGKNSGHARVYGQISPCSGCTDSTSNNFDPLALVDDGTCITCVYGCTDPFACNYDSLSTCNDGSCIGLIGCTDSLGDNYNSNATCDDGSCTYLYLCSNPKPDGLYAYNITDNKAMVGWNDMNSIYCMVLKYYVRYRPVGTNTWITKSAGAGSGLCLSGLLNVTKQLNNLIPSTTYEYRMKAFYCGGISSAYSPPSYFTTEGLCPNMTNLTVTTYTQNTNKARFDWDTTGLYVFARIALRVDIAGSSWQNAGGFGVYYPTLYVNKFGLQQGQSYRAQGRTFCDSTILSYRSPNWTPLVFWTQPGTIKLNGGQTIKNLNVYPNPSRDIFNISFNSEEIQDLKVRILNVIGEVVYEESLEQFTGEYIKSVNLSKYVKAIYFLEIQTNDGIINKKLILQ
jgi:hypothetical protein